MKNEPRRSWLLIASAGLLLLCWLVFGQTLAQPFTVVDDHDYVVENSHVNHGLTSTGVAWAFTHTHSGNWHPMTWISHMLDCQLYGLNPRGHHLTNVLLHSASAVLLFLVLHAMTGALGRSAVVAAVFAVHPLRAESVAWIAERKDVLSALFFMLTLAAYRSYARRPFAAWRYSLVLVFFAFGLMSKPMLVTLPCVLLLLDHWPMRRRLTRSLLLEKLPFFALAAAACAPTLFAQQPGIVPLETVPISARLANSTLSLVGYLRQLVWPTDLAAFYPFTGITFYTAALALAVVIAISSAVVLWREQRYLVTGWLWYLVMLLPVLGILQVGEQAHADRYTYLPQIGVLLALAWGIVALAERLRLPAWSPGLGAFVVVIAFTVQAHQTVATWRDPEALWRHALAQTPDNAVARANLAHALYGKGARAAAVVEFERSLELSETQPLVHSSLGGILLELERAPEAKTHLDRALQLNPEAADALSNLGLLALESGNAATAIPFFAKAVALAPDLASAQYNYGNALLELGRGAEAATRFASAVELDPRDERALNNLAWILATCPEAAVRNGPQAVFYAQRAEALTQQSSSPIAATLAAAYAESGRMEEAISTAQRAVAIAEVAGDSGRADYIRTQLLQYRAGLPVRDDRFTPAADH